MTIALGRRQTLEEMEKDHVFKRLWQKEVWLEGEGKLSFWSDIYWLAETSFKPTNSQKEDCWCAVTSALLQREHSSQQGEWNSLSRGWTKPGRKELPGYLWPKSVSTWSQHSGWNIYSSESKETQILVFMQDRRPSNSVSAKSYKLFHWSSDHLTIDWLQHYTIGFDGLFTEEHLFSKLYFCGFGFSTPTET